MQSSTYSFHCTSSSLFYSDCLADFVHPDMCRDTAVSLEKLGYEVRFPQKQSCCGIPTRYSGEMDVARDMARINVDVLLESEADYVVTICPTCTMSLRHDFPKLLDKEPDYREKAVRLAAKVFNYSELASRKMSVAKGKRPGDCGIITYHDACHL